MLHDPHMVLGREHGCEAQPEQHRPQVSQRDFTDSRQTELPSTILAVFRLAAVNWPGPSIQLDAFNQQNAAIKQGGLP